MKATTVLIGEVSSQPFNSYYLMESETENGKIFGVMVSNINDECCIPGLFDSRERAECFAVKIMENNVSPIHLADVADDYLGGEAWDLI